MPRTSPAGHSRVQHRRDRPCIPRCVPAEFGVALVRREHGSQFAGPCDGGAQEAGIQHAAVGIARGVEPDQSRALRPRGGVVRGRRGRPHQPGADLVRGVRRTRMHHDVALCQIEQQRQKSDELLRADRGEHVVRRESGHATTAVVPVDDRLSQCGCADGLRVGVRVGRPRQRVGHDGRGGVHRRADRQIDDPAGVRTRTLRVWCDGIPGVVGEVSDAHGGLTVPAGAGRR